MRGQRPETRNRWPHVVHFIDVRAAGPACV